MKKLRLSIIGVFFSVLSYAGVHTVDNRPGSAAQFTTVNSAMSAATNGDTLLIHPSTTSYGNINVTKGLVFIGPGHHPEMTGGIGAKLNTVSIRNGSSNSKFIGLIMDRIECYVWAASNNVEIRNNFMIYHSLIAGSYGDNSASSNWIIEGNVLIENSGCGGCVTINIRGGVSWVIRNNFISTQVSTSNSTILFDNLSSSINVENNIIIHNNLKPIFGPDVDGGGVKNNIIWATQAAFTDLMEDATNVNFSNNLTYHSNGSLLELTGDDNIDNSDPEFMFLTDESPAWNYENDYQLEATSLGSGAGEDGTDVGIYGGSYIFRMEGYPQDFPRFIEFDVTSNTILPPGGTLDFSIHATKAGQ